MQDVTALQASAEGVLEQENSHILGVGILFIIASMFLAYFDFILQVVFYINAVSEVFHIRAQCSISRKSRAVFRAKRWCVVSLAGILRVSPA